MKLARIPVSSREELPLTLVRFEAGDVQRMISLFEFTIRLLEEASRPSLVRPAPQSQAESLVDLLESYESGGGSLQDAMDRGL
jgi:hypothetical protein